MAIERELKPGEVVVCTFSLEYYGAVRGISADVLADNLQTTVQRIQPWLDADYPPTAGARMAIVERDRFEPWYLVKMGCGAIFPLHPMFMEEISPLEHLAHCLEEESNG